MRDRLEITLPFPPRELSPNSRDGWWLKSRVARQYREDCAWLAVEARNKAGITRSLPTPVTASVVFVVKDRRKRDSDNLLASFKAGIDGIVNSGLLIGDDHERFKIASVTVEVLEHQDDCRKIRYHGFAGSPNTHAKCTCGSPCVRVVLSHAGEKA